MPRVLLRKVYAGGVKGGRGQGDRGPGTQGPGKGGKAGRGTTSTREAGLGQGAGAEKGSRGEGCLANFCAPCSRWPEGGGKGVEAKGQRHAKHGPYAHCMPRLD